MLKLYEKPIIQQIKDPWLSSKGVTLAVKREDRIHPHVSGNKWRKLKYNLEETIRQGKDTVLTFGGAYSNHIYATAAAAHEAGLKSIGIIRGDELADQSLNATLTFAKGQGMHLYFVSRDDYRNKTSDQFLSDLKNRFGDFYLVPEGGTNPLAIQGASEILGKETELYDVIVAAVGTGGTISGIISAAQAHQQVIGIASLKGDFLQDEVVRLLEQYDPTALTKSWQIETSYHFGGYAKTTATLMEFIQRFEFQHDLPLEQVYTGKAMYAIYDMIELGAIKRGQSVLFIHTGGLQGRNI